MLTMLKRIIGMGFIIGSLVVIGCNTCDVCKPTGVENVDRTGTRAFNDEKYVWEEFQFTEEQVKEQGK